jgi:Fe2+ transport system protein FeoA
MFPVVGRLAWSRSAIACCAKLKQHGLHLGDTLRVLRSAPLGGPLLVEVDGRELALGRAVAEHLLVETECESH